MENSQRDKEKCLTVSDGGKKKMSEYIDREEAIKRIKLARQIVTSSPPTASRIGYFLTNRDALDFLAAIPAADVQPVHHGHWIQERKDVGGCFKLYQTYIHCSECGKEHFSGGPPKPNFCDECGARMGGDEE